MIDRLLTVFQQAGLLISDELASSEVQSLLGDEDIADAIWLAVQIERREPEPNELERTDEVQDRPLTPLTDKTVVTTGAVTTADGSTDPIPPIPAYLPEPSRQETSAEPAFESSEGLPIQVRAAPALQDARSIARSFRPLRRKVPSLSRCVLDEAATVDRIAERDVWVPVLKPALDRWLDLDLVIESSAFSFIWQETLDEFQQILERQGAFRNVRAWRVEGVDEGQLHLVPNQQTLTQQTSFRSPKELIDPSGRRLVLYVSDCRSPVWQQGKIHEWLKLWGQRQPTAIVQLLPERLWEQSELDVGVGVQVSALLPGVPNPKLVMHDFAYWDNETPDHLLLSVVTLTARSLRQLALVVAAVGNQRAPARLFDLSWVSDPERERAPSVIQPETAEERVELFLATASPIARQLARMMAAVPVSLSVVHLIQDRLLKDLMPVHVAEVYSSSLLTAVQSFPTATEELGRCDFFPGVRRLLNERTAEDETIDVLQVLSQEIARTLGLPSIRSFTALLSPKLDWTVEAKAAILPFAQVATQVLHNLGGEFASLAEQVEREAARRKDWIQPLEDSVEDAIPNFPELKILDFTTAQLVEASPSNAFPPLQTQEVEVVTIIFEADEIEPEPAGFELFKFESAILERRTQQPGFLQNLFRREPSVEWVIRKQRRQAQRWIEKLGESTQLEMIIIPPGSFMMGSPEDESDLRSAETPQHQVKVDTFLMGRYPITQAQWKFVAGLPQARQALDPDPSRFKGDDRPVEQVSWYEAVEFCDRLSLHTGRDYRLPSEAEWEYACRAGTTTLFHFGSTLSTELANYNGDSTYNDEPRGSPRKQTTPIDYFNVANVFGLSDMHGNIREWCQDHWHSGYDGAPTDGNAWLSENENSHRLLRGGSWNREPRLCRSAYRNSLPPDNRNSNIGFRVVVSLRTLWQNTRQVLP